MTTDTTTEITEGDWKTLATTEITHLTDEEKDYLPRAWDEWIARVRRDAAREALDGLAAWLGELAEKHPARSTHVPLMQGHIARHATDHYPEGTP